MSGERRRKERSPTLGKLDESSRRGRPHSPWRSQTFLSRRGGGRRGALAAAMVATFVRPDLGPRYAGRKNESEPRPSSFRGAAAWAPRGAAPPPSSLGHITAEGRTPPVPSPHATPRSWRYRGLRPGRAPGRAAGAVSGAPAPPRPGSCQFFGRSLCRRLPRTPARAETGHGQSLNSAIGRAKARHIRARESGDRPGWRNERGAKAREGVTGKASLQNAELAACRESGEHCSANSQGRGHEEAA